MKSQLPVLLVGVQVLLGSLAWADTYVPGPAMSCFHKGVGKWHEDLAKEMGDGWVRNTKGSYGQIYNVFTIEASMSNGISDFGWVLHVQEQNQVYCHAVYYEGMRSRYYHGTPKRGDQMIVMKSLVPSLKQEKFLVIDLRGCPKKPPKVTATNELPEGVKEPSLK